MSRGGSTLRGRKGERGRRLDKIRRNNQPVQMKRASRGWTTTEATSGDNNNDDHNDAGASYSKIKLHHARDDHDDNATMPGLSREGVKVKTGAAVAAAVTVAIMAADNNRNGGGRQQSLLQQRQWQRQWSWQR